MTANQNFVDKVGPIITAAWLNIIDQAVNGTAVGQGAALIPYLPPGTGAVGGNVGVELARAVFANDFAANGVSGALVDPTGVLDSTAGIQAAINYIGPLGGEVLFAPGIYKFSSTLNVGNGVGSTFSTINGIRLRGMAPAGGLLTGSPQAKVTLNYTGTGIAVSINGPIVDWGLSNIQIFTSNISATSIGLYLNQASYGRIENLIVSQFGKYGIQVTATNVASQANHWTSVLVFLPAGQAATQGIRISSDAAGFDVWGDTWSHVYIIPSVATQTGLYLGATDTNFFYHLAIQPIAGKGIVFDYSFNNAWPGGMFFHGLDVYNNSITNVGTPTNANATPLNKVFNLSRVNGTAVPYIRNLQVFDYAPFSRTKLYMNGAQSIGNAGTQVLLDTVDTDLDGVGDLVNHRVLPFRPGTYRVTGQVTYANAGASSLCVGITEKNASTIIGIGYGNNLNNQASAICEGWVTCNGSTDFIGLYGQNTSGSVALLVGQTYYTYLMVEGPF